MPEMRFTVRWPDASVTECYSPSLVIKDYMSVGCSYLVEEFVDRSRTALNIASERVREKYGYACSSALDQLRAIETTASRFADMPDASVEIERFQP
jgi:uncharacterized repeat protein (TIGR04042 family)